MRRAELPGRPSTILSSPPRWIPRPSPARRHAPSVCHAARRPERLTWLTSGQRLREISFNFHCGTLCVDMEPAYPGLGRCTCCFWAAVAFDIVGLLVLLIGVFANVFFYDLLVYAGAIVIFLSLIWWVFWYSGNIEVPPAELEDDVGLLKKKKGGVGGLVRRFSNRVSSGIRNSFRRDGSVTGRASQVAPQVVIGMRTMTPQEDALHTVSTVASSDVQMPHTTTESSPT